MYWNFQLTENEGDFPSSFFWLWCFIISIFGAYLFAWIMFLCYESKRNETNWKKNPSSLLCFPTLKLLCILLFSHWRVLWSSLCTTHGTGSLITTLWWQASHWGGSFWRLPVLVWERPKADRLLSPGQCHKFCSCLLSCCCFTVLSKHKVCKYKLSWTKLSCGIVQ